MKTKLHGLACLITAIILTAFAAKAQSGTLSGHKYVDLGLPSGTLWATTNVGADTPAEAGWYFAWGEVLVKYLDGGYTSSNSQTTGKSMADISGNPEYDAAAANWGGSWRMPTKRECEEMVDNCTFKWTRQDGMYGALYTSKINGNSIFLPAAGHYFSEPSKYDEWAEYWSSTPDGDENAFSLFLHEGSNSNYNNPRYWGLPVRPVASRQGRPAASQVQAPQNGQIAGVEYVDLGLPSGLKWATCNLGATTPEEYGSFYAWGETGSKSRYTSANSLTDGRSMNMIDGDERYDAARANLGSPWRMPTKNDFNELIDNCTFKWTSRNGVSGALFTSKANGNSIFLPAAGEFGEERNHYGSWGFYRTANYTDDERSPIFRVNDENGADFYDDSYRYWGLSVRPVAENGGSSRPSASSSAQSASYKGHQYVDMGLPSGTLWATANIGSSTPEGYGSYFAWGETSAKGTYTENNSATYGLSMGDIGGKQAYDAATANWGGSWRLPTEDEFRELARNTTCEFTTINGHSGIRLTSNINGNSIFLPAAGYYCPTLSRKDEWCEYWCSTPDNAKEAYNMHFSSTSPSVFSSDKYLGQSVRPVVSRSAVR